MNLKLNEWLKSFKTDKNPGFIKKQILNTVLLSIIGLVFFVCFLLLIIIAYSKKDLDNKDAILKGFGYFFFVVSIVAYSTCGFLIFFLNKNSEFVKKKFGNKINFLLIIFWKGFNYVDLLTELEIENNYIFDKQTKVKKAKFTKKISSGSVDFQSKNINRTIRTNATVTAIHQPNKTNNTTTNKTSKNQSLISANNKEIIKVNLEDKINRYEFLLKKQQELQKQLDEIKKEKHLKILEENSATSFNQDYDSTISLLEQEIKENTIKIENTNHRVTVLIDQIDFSSKTKMIAKKEELEKIYHQYQKLKESKK